MVIRIEGVAALPDAVNTANKIAKLGQTIFMLEGNEPTLEHICFLITGKF